MNILSEIVTPETKTIIEVSSGSMALSLAIIARIFYGITDTRAYIMEKSSTAKVRLLPLFRLDIYVTPILKLSNLVLRY